MINIVQINLIFAYMNIKHLKSFVETAHCGSFSLAATRLHTVQSAISRHINGLEQSLNIQLFERTTRHVELTAAGKVFLQHIDDILVHLEQAKYEAQSVQSGKKGLLRIAYLSSACAHFMPHLVRKFHLSEPHIEVQIFEMTVSEQRDAFSEGRIEIGFSRPIETGYEALIQRKHLTNDPIVVAIADTHPLAHRETLSLNDVGAFPLTLFNRAHAQSMFDTIISAFHQANVQPNISDEPASMQALLTHIASNQSIGLVPSCIKNLQTEGCRFIPLDTALFVPLEMHWKMTPSATTKTWLSWFEKQSIAVYL